MHKSFRLIIVLPLILYFSLIPGCGKEDRDRLDRLISPDETKPKISNVSAAPARTTAKVSWLTDEPATSRVEYRESKDKDFSNLQSEDDSLLTNHNIYLSNLKPGTIYYYCVESRDREYNWGRVCDGFKFTTKPADDTPPVITNVRAVPEARCVTIKWDTNEPATSQVDYGRTTQYVSSTPFDADLVLTHSMRFCGLNPRTTYYYRVKSEDAAGNQATAEADFGESFTFTTKEEECPTPPVISKVVISTGRTSATISWQTNVPATAQVAYGQTANYGTFTTKQTALVTSHTVTLTGLSPGTGYHFKILSEDACGNQATPSDGKVDRTFTTTSEEECPVLPTISNVSVTPEKNSATITWKTNVPAIGQVDYGRTSNYGSSTSKETTFSQNHSVTLTGLTPGAEYHFKISAEDKCGNKATPTDSVIDRTFTTKAEECSVSPLISNVQVYAGATRAIISWQTNVPTTGRVRYGLSLNYDLEANDPNTGLSTLHTVRLPGAPPPYLDPETTYLFSILSADACNNLAPSVDQQFTTSASGFGLDPNIIEVKAGDEFKIEVWAENVNNLFGCVFKIDYNKRILDVEESGAVEAGWFLGEKPLVSDYLEENGIASKIGVVTKKGSELGGASGTGLVAIVKFKARASGKTTIKLDRDGLTLRNSQGEMLDISGLALGETRVIVVP
ncbi:MAG: fibronectin type III domain-containing protein [bacterium]|nr:fibronectin type III domain-containing protein [bacterium]